jgi:hypothetical protein
MTALQSPAIIYLKVLSNGNYGERRRFMLLS